MNPHTDTRDKALNASAESILSVLPRASAQVLRESALMQNLHLWMLVAGLIQRSYDNGEYTAPALDPTWVGALASMHETGEEKVCPICDQTFTPRWYGQLYNRPECGAAAQRAERMRMASVDHLERHVVGEEPETVIKSTLGHDTGTGERGPTLTDILDTAAAALASERDAHEPVAPRTMGRGPEPAPDSV